MSNTEILNTVKIDNLLGAQISQNTKYSNTDEDLFSKIFESAGKSYDLSREQISGQDFNFQTDESYSFQDNFQDTNLSSNETLNNFLVKNDDFNSESKTESKVKEKTESDESTDSEKTKIDEKEDSSVEKSTEKPKEKEAEKTKDSSTENKDKTAETEQLNNQLMAQQIAEQQRIIKHENKPKITASDSNESEKVISNNKNTAITESKVQHNKNSANEALANLQKEKSSVNSKNTQNNETNSIKQSQTNTKIQNAEVEIAEDQLPTKKFDVNELTNKTKVTGEMTNELKPVITKLNVNLNNQSSNHQNQNRDAKPDILSINNIDNNAAKLQFEKANNFSNVLGTVEKTIGNAATGESVINQVAKKAMEHIQNKSELNNLDLSESEVSLNLRPANLGKVNINLVTKEGSLSAVITAESDEVKNILDNGVENLKQKLSEQGINVDNISVKVQEPTKPDNANNQFQFDQKFNQAEQNMFNSNSNLEQNNQNSSMQGETSYDLEDQSLQTEEEESQTTSTHVGQVDYTV